MKNITVSVNDEVYRRARIVAAQQDTSVSALVRDFLSNMEFGEDGSSQERPWDQVWEAIDACKARVGDPPSRSRTYDDRRFS